MIPVVVAGSWFGAAGRVSSVTRERTIEANGVTFAALEAGDGGHPLLLVHGWTGAKEDFADWMEPLAELGHHVVAPDHRGHGDSAKPASEDEYSLAIMATDMVGITEALGWDRFVLLGHSMGGMVAQTLALGSPELLVGLILMDTHHGPIEVEPAVVDAGVQAVRALGIDAIADMMASATEPGPLDTEAYRRVCAERPGHFETGITKTRRSSAEMFAAMLVEMSQTPSRLSALAGLDVPTLVMVGDQDVPFIAASEAMADTIPGARYALLPDAGHSPQFEAPDAWWEAMSSFLVEVRGS